MRWHLAARIHSAAHDLLKPKDAREVKKLEREVRQLFEKHGIADQKGLETHLTDIADKVLSAFDLETVDDRSQVIIRLVIRLFDYEGLFQLPQIDWGKKYSIAEYWEIRDALNQQKALVENFEANKQLITQFVGVFIQQIYEACPALYERVERDDGVTIESELLEGTANLPQLVETIIGLPFTEELIDNSLFERLRRQIESNLVIASGGNPNDPKAYERAPKAPDQFKAQSKEHMLSTYLGATPLLDFFDQKLSFTIPTKTRFEHHHIVAGSGHGKTQTLQYLIAHDLEAVAAGKRSIVVIDSQNDLISTISQMQVFAPGGPLHDRIVIIDPNDVEYPVSLNLFDVGTDRMAGYEQLERERLTNSILELYDFVLGSLLDAQMTQKQSVIFRYVTRLMLHIPDATIHTLRDLMEPKADERFAEHIAKLTGTARHFFETEFSSREFEQTKRQVLRRLWGILENRTFERMFSHPRSKLQLYDEMNAGKVILINTAKDLLKEGGSQIFGRFFIAMIAQAAQERAVLSKDKRMPTFVYIDEAADYFDHNVQTILEQARKYNVGMVLAHQFLGQLDSRLEQAFDANTSIKFAGGVSARDARTMASMMRCDPQIIEQQSKGGFAAHVRGVHAGALPLKIPFGLMEQQPRMSSAEKELLRAKMRNRYAVHIDDLAQTETGNSSDQDEAKTEAHQSNHVDTDASDTW